MQRLLSPFFFVLFVLRGAELSDGNKKSRKWIFAGTEPGKIVDGCILVESLDGDFSGDTSNQNKCQAAPTCVQLSGAIKLSGERNTRPSTEEHLPAARLLLDVTDASNRSCQRAGTRHLRNIKHVAATRFSLYPMTPAAFLVFVRHSGSVPVFLFVSVN